MTRPAKPGGTAFQATRQSTAAELVLPLCATGEHGWNRPGTPLALARASLTACLWVGLTRMVQFAAPAEHYDLFMGRYAPTLAVALADIAGVGSGMRVVDVGCGPGGLARELATRVGVTNVAAIDPAPQFVAARRDRNPACGTPRRAA